MDYPSSRCSPRACRESYVRPRHVVEMLLHSREFPRSVLFCLSELQLAIHSLSKCPVNLYDNEAERLCGRLISDLLYTSIDEMLALGLHEFLDHVIDEIGRVTVALSERYMFYPVVDRALEAAREAGQSPRSRNRIATGRAVKKTKALLLHGPATGRIVKN